MTISDKEKIITFLIDEFENSKNNEVSISKNDLEKINLTEQQIVKILYLLQSDNLIKIKVKSVHDDFSRFWTVELNSSCVFYFEGKRTAKTNNRREWVRTYIPLIISSIALIKSFMPEIILIVEQLWNIVKQLLK